jgi:hypothetical protein
MNQVVKTKIPREKGEYYIMIYQSTPQDYRETLNVYALCLAPALTVIAVH